MKLLLPYLAVAVLAGGAGVAAGWQAHPDGVEWRQFHGVVINVDSNQKSIGIRTTEYGRIGGWLVHEGHPVESGQTVTGRLYDNSVIEIPAD